MTLTRPVAPTRSVTVSRPVSLRRMVGSRVRCSRISVGGTLFGPGLGPATGRWSDRLGGRTARRSNRTVQGGPGFVDLAEGVQCAVVPAGGLPVAATGPHERTRHKHGQDQQNGDGDKERHVKPSRSGRGIWMRREVSRRVIEERPLGGVGPPAKQAITTDFVPLLVLLARLVRRARFLFTVELPGPDGASHAPIIGLTDLRVGGPA